MVSQEPKYESSIHPVQGAEQKSYEGHSNIIADVEAERKHCQPDGWLRVGAPERAEFQRPT